MNGHTTPQQHVEKWRLYLLYALIFTSKRILLPSPFQLADNLRGSYWQKPGEPESEISVRRKEATLTTGTDCISA